MPPQRSPLGPISGNRLLGAHLSPYARGVIAGKASAGAKPSEIAAELKLEYSTVYRTIQLDLARHEGASLHRTPRKKSYTEADERILLRHVRLNPKDTYAMIKIVCGLACSKSTLRKILKEHGITNWRAKRRPFLTEKNAVARLKWCLERQHWLAEDWALVVWSDVSRAGAGSTRRMGISYTRTEMAPSNDPNIRYKEEYESYGLGIVLGHWAKLSLYYGP